MGWICHICDTYNQEKDNQCFVCGQGRLSVATVAKPARGRKKKKDKHWDVCNYIFNLCRAVFFICVSVAVVALVISLISKVTTGSLSDIAICAKECFRKVKPEWLKYGLIILLGGF